ncbi:amidohydrolase [bacterium]|nr:amidohydrolase [bacterium]
MTIFLNGKIYTGYGQEVEALAVSNGRILATGTNRDLISFFPSFKQIDLEKQRVLPAFTDAHTHFLAYCLKQDQLDFNGLTSKEEVLELVRKKATHTPKGEWIQGSGWNQNLWNPVKYPSKEDLDTAAPDHPVCLEARDAHTSWVNSSALKKAGITRETTFDSTGEILKNADGNLSGIIKEEARQLIWQFIEKPTAEKRQDVLRNGMKLAYAQGLSGVHCMETISDWETYQTLHRDGELKLRVNFYYPIRYLDHVIELGLKSGLGNEWLRFGGMKIFLDGTLGSQTAHMIKPFENSDNYGTEILTEEAVNSLVFRAAQNNIACAIHAIGDRANRKALHAFSAVRRKFPEKRLRQRIEHCQLVDPADMPRFAEHEIIASMQPIQIPEDVDTANKFWGERCRYAYPFRSLLQAGAVLAFGSDVPIETCNVFEGIFAALNRSKRGGIESWIPEQKLELQEIIHAYTIGSAFASGEESIKGSLNPGKVADFMILSDNIFNIPATEIPKIKVKMMVIGGEKVYG